MSSFVNLYNHDIASRYLDAMEYDDQMKELYAIGLNSQNALLAKIDKNGDLLWEKEYQIQSGRVYGRSVVKAPNGDLICYGGIPTNVARRSHHFLMRVKPDGSIVWARKVFSANTRTNARLIASVDDTYYFIGWFNTSGSSDDMELVKIDGGGNILNHTIVGTGSDDQISSIIPYGDGCIIVGGTSQGPGWDGAIVAFDGNLKVLWKRLIGDSSHNDILDIADIGNDTFALVGYSATQRRHFLMTFKPTLTSHDVVFFDAGDENFNLTKLVYAGGHIYFSGYENVIGAYCIKFTTSLAAVWRKKIEFAENAFFYRPVVNNAGDQIIFIGFTGDSAILVKTDLELSSCITTDLSALSFTQGKFRSNDWNTTFRSVTLSNLILSVAFSNLDVELNQLCQQETCIPLDNTAAIQSPYLYLEAAGSDSSDGSVRGIHTRWDFRRSLGENHLPKGDLTSSPAYATSIGFNRADDYVRLYRVEYVDQFPIIINVNVAPNQLEETGAIRRWIYTGLTATTGITRNIEILFTDNNEYDQTRALINPAVNPGQFIRDCRSVMEIRVVGQLCFKASFVGMKFDDDRLSFLKTEMISWADTLDESSRYVSCRKTIVALGGSSESLLCENMEYIRFESNTMTINEIHLYTYEDTMTGYNQEPCKWQEVGSFALTDQDSVAYGRLEEPIVDKKWRKFNQSNATTGDYVVNSANYKDRWIPNAAPTEGLKEGVIQYLTLSKTDPQALATQADEEGTSFTEIAYLDYLRIVSLDFHIGRVLGFGHIDDMSASAENKEFIYVAAYVTEAALEEGAAPALVTHFYMTLPTSQKDYKQPPTPKLKPVDYGLYVENGTTTPTLLSDPDGYAPFPDAPNGSIRYVNISKERFWHEYPLMPFYLTDEEFCICDKSLPVMFGLEQSLTNPVNFLNVDDLGDEEYFDHNGNEEVLSIPDNGNPDEAIYTHAEKYEGVHWYRMYSINWFSRISPLSTPIDTDYSVFPKLNSLIPPSNFAVQLIQKENPLIFTTTNEQTMLDNLTGDKTLVRAIFDWNQIHNIAYQYANQVEFFFRALEPKVVRGEIGTVTEISDHRVTIATSSYQVNSGSTAQQVTPFVDPSDTNKFIGSLLIADEVPFVVESVTPGANPVFTLKQVRQTLASSPSNNDQYLVTQDFISPTANTRFIVYENLSSEDSWDFKLNKTVALPAALQSYTEQRVESDGSITNLSIGGLFDTAQITDIPDPSGTPTKTGYYKIVFDNIVLPPHSDPDIEWFKGTVRIMENANLFPPSNSANYRLPEMKSLQVLSVGMTSGGSPQLEIIVVDAAFQATPSNPNPQLDYMPIGTGSGVDVNFHPSYRLYFKVDQNGGNTFDEATILPASGEGTRMTYMGVRAADTTVSPAPCYSYMSNPAVILAREFLIPEPPGVPDGPLFATRPDFYGKGSYTFNSEVKTDGRTPYALVFYRANERKILDELYKPETVADILNTLFSTYGEEDDFFTSRWNGLVNVEHDGTNFLDYDGYTFPLPDNPDYVIPNANPTIQDKPFVSAWDFSQSFAVTLYNDPGTGNPVTESRSMEQIVIDAIQGAFLSLTEQPVLYKYIKSGYQTSNQRPKIKDANGDLLVPGNPIDFSVFDPFPMIVKYTESGNPNTFVRFSDYTLDASSRSFFFYFAVELNNRFEVSDASPIAGPIQLVNSAPAEEPGIKKVFMEEPDEDLELPLRVRFELNEFIGTEGIRQFQIYRTVDSSEALSVRTMKLAGTVSVGDELLDDFSDLDFPPYGEPLFYRVVALREIRNEQGAPELVPSKPSNIALTTVADIANPPAPVLGFMSDPPIITTIAELPNVVIKWEKTVHNGLYYLYKMGEKGNWVLIHELETNDDSITVDLSITDLGSSTLIKRDEEGNTKYHHFKVIAENASGLQSLEEKILTI